MSHAGNCRATPFAKLGWNIPPEKTMRGTRLAAALIGLALAICAGTAAAFDLANTPGALSRHVVPLRYSIEIEADPYATRFSGIETIELDVRKPTREILLHADHLSVRALALDGREVSLPVKLNADAGTATIRLPSSLPVGHHQLKLAWEAPLDAKGDGLYVAPYKTPDGQAKKMLVTDMEPIGARRMMPLFDEPAFRAVFEMSVVTPERFTAISNMPSVAEEALPDGRKRVRFAPTPKMASYLVALAIGELESAKADVDGVGLEIWATEGHRAQMDFALDATSKLLHWYHDYFGIRYPLPKLSQLAVPGMGGAMENWGLITYGEELLLLDAQRAGVTEQAQSYAVIAHEIAHQWFGNLVTMAWWDDLWLNEAFAEWMGVKATRTLNPEWRELDRLASSRGRALDDDSLSTAHAIRRPIARDSEAFDSFDSATYDKGRMMVGLVEQYLGEEVLRAGIHRHLQQHAFSNATGTDFWRALEDASGRPVRRFAEAWTTRPGHPQIALACSADGSRLEMRQRRYGFGAVPRSDTVWPVPLQLASASDSRSLMFSQARSSLPWPCTQAYALTPGEYDMWRTGYDEAGLKTLIARFDRASPALRERLIDDTWALVQTGSARFSDLLSMIDALRPDDAAPVWRAALAVFDEVDMLMAGEPERVLWRERALRHTEALAASLDALSAEDADKPVWRSLQAELVGLRGRWGDSGVLTRAKEQFGLATPSVDADEFRALLGVLAEQGDGEAIDALIGRVRANSNPAMLRADAAALGRVGEPVQIQKVLALSMDDAVPRSVRNSILDRVAGNGHAREVWQFTRSHLDALLARVSPWQRRELLAASLNGSRDEALAAEVRALAVRTLDASELSDVDMAVARVARNAEAWRHIQAQLGSRLAAGHL
jgi:aminopeptidase N